jgi:hypothetical protein
MTERTKQSDQAGAGLVAQIETVSAGNFGDSTINVAEIATNKLEIDLLSWSTLGSTTKQNKQMNRLKWGVENDQQH